MIASAAHPTGRGHRCRLPVLALVCCRVLASPALGAEPSVPLKAILLEAGQATDQRLERVAAQKYNTVVLGLDDTDKTRLKEVAVRIGQRGLELHYWIEIGRNPALADAHPEWMASVQTHPEWRRFFPNVPPLKDGEVIKAWPWVPALYEETFPVHLDRVRALLEELPAGRAVYLNDLQGGPSACGCGHPLCRWTTDYGPITTARRLPDNAAARLVASIQSLAPASRIVPVWATECEEGDRDGLCGGVGCFNGTCWKALTAQVGPVAQGSDQIGLLLLFREFQRDLPRYGDKAAWIAHALDSMSAMPRKHKGTPIPPQRLIAVLQGWDVTPEDIQAQVNQASQAGAAGYIVAEMKIEQSWQPRLHQPGKPARPSNAP